MEAWPIKAKGCRLGCLYKTMESKCSPSKQSSRSKSFQFSWANDIIQCYPRESVTSSTFRNVLKTHLFPVNMCAMILMEQRLINFNCYVMFCYKKLKRKRGNLSLCIKPHVASVKEMEPRCAALAIWISLYIHLQLLLLLLF